MIELSVGVLVVPSGARIRANGAVGTNGLQSVSSSYVAAVNGGGGGAGGSVLISATRIEGSGKIEATGGAGGAAGKRGNWQHAGGGGGGGRIAIRSAFVSSSVVMDASAGVAGGNPSASAAARGAPGHVYTEICLLYTSPSPRDS